ncbi:hypothetical protein [Roseateles sp.]|uniref:hypothetical protein n=1 Tax=Roseateles sp. TaxID=1971397 RepID=UPI003262E9E8
MNMLLHELKRRGFMLHDCIAVAAPEQAVRVIENAGARVPFFMGSEVRPGPFWCVQEADAPALETAGYWRLDRSALIDLGRPPLALSLAALPGIRFRVRPLAGRWQGAGHWFRR